MSISGKFMPVAGPVPPPSPPPDIPRAKMWREAKVRLDDARAERETVRAVHDAAQAQLSAARSALDTAKAREADADRESRAEPDDDDALTAVARERIRVERAEAEFTEKQEDAEKTKEALDAAESAVAEAANRVDIAGLLVQLNDGSYEAEVEALASGIVEAFNTIVDNVRRIRELGKEENKSVRELHDRGGPTSVRERDGVTAAGFLYRAMLESPNPMRFAGPNPWEVKFNLDDYSSLPSDPHAHPVAAALNLCGHLGGALRQAEHSERAGNPNYNVHVMQNAAEVFSQSRNRLDAVKEFDRRQQQRGADWDREQQAAAEAPIARLKAMKAAGQRRVPPRPEIPSSLVPRPHPGTPEKPWDGAWPEAPPQLPGYNEPPGGFKV